MIRIFDIFFSFIGLIVLSPVWLISLFLVWLEDRNNPIYTAWRIGLNGKLFRMFKIRTMIIEADKNKIDTTSKNDPRLTRIGKVLRRYKIDEMLQLINVLNGTMSFVGPRPNVKREVDIYTQEERKLLTVKPGITDISSVVFSDLAEIMVGYNDPNIAYNQLVRPWKSRLGIFYIENKNLLLNIKLLCLTIISMLSRKAALNMIVSLLIKMKADILLINICRRDKKLKPYPPPGSINVIVSRN